MDRGEAIAKFGLAPVVALQMGKSYSVVWGPIHDRKRVYLGKYTGSFLCMRQMSKEIILYEAADVYFKDNTLVLGIKEDFIDLRITYNGTENRWVIPVSQRNPISRNFKSVTRRGIEFFNDYMAQNDRTKQGINPLVRQ